MNPRFLWQTEDGPSGPEVEPDAKPASSRRRWVLGAIGIVALLAALFLWQQSQRVAVQEANIQADVIASHYTWQEAIATADLELFTYLISSSDTAWQAAQKQLFSRRLVLDRTPLGLVAGATPPQVTAVSLDPTWRTATVTYEQRYHTRDRAPSANRSQTQDLRLQQISRYRLHQGRWVQTPLPADVWGETKTYAGRRLRLTYPQRDAAWAERLGAELDAELDAICHDSNSPSPHVTCPAQIRIQLSADPASLAALRDGKTPAFAGRSYLLPTFTLVGAPVDDAGYDALYRGYTARILSSFRARLRSPAPMPEQDLVALCFPDRRQPLRLFRYDLRADAWTAVFPDRAFRFLTPLPDDSSLILQESMPSSEANRLQLSHWEGEDEKVIFDEPDSRWRFPPVGWSRSHLLLHGFDAASQVRTLYQWVDLDDCQRGECATEDLSGFTVWAPHGRSSLVVRGSALWLGDAMGRPLRRVAEGFNPFWLDNSTFGYVRYNEAAEERVMELVAASADDASRRVLLRGEQLTTALGDDAGLAFIRHAIPSPADPRTIILMGPEIRGGDGRYNVFVLRLKRDWQNQGDPAMEQLTLALQLERPPRGYPTQLPPTGMPPVTFSPDGRWLVAAELTYPEKEIWTFHLYDLASGETNTVGSNAPDYPAYHPFYDWSGNGRWLAIIDDGFIRLLAPGHDYEQLIPFDFAACLFPAWVN